MPQIVDRIDFACADVEDSNQWPKLSCGGANQLRLEAGGLRLEANRELFFEDNGQLRSFDDSHKLVFNRAGNSLDLCESGDIRLLTGAPTPTEKVRVGADGALRVTGNITVSGELSAVSNISLGAGGAATPAARFSPGASGGLRVTVANATDEVRFATETDSSFAHLDLRAGLATARGNLTVQGNLTVAGTIQGNIAANAIGLAQLVDGVVNSVKLADGAVNTAKIVNKAVTLSKIADGVLPPAIGIAVVTGLQHGQSIPVPSGFTRAECVFFVALKFLVVDPNNGRTIYNCSADGQGKVSISPDGSAVAVGVALAKKGGW